MESFWLFLAGTRLIISPHTSRKPDKVYEMKVARHCTVASSVFLERKVVYEESPLSASAFCLERGHAGRA